MRPAHHPSLLIRPPRTLAKRLSSKRTYTYYKSISDLINILDLQSHVDGCSIPNGVSPVNFRSSYPYVCTLDLTHVPICPVAHYEQALSALMVLGWPLLSVTLCKWTDLGVFKGLMACTSVSPFLSPTLIGHIASGLYALTFGLLGLVPAPMVIRR